MADMHHIHSVSPFFDRFFKALYQETADGSGIRQDIFSPQLLFFCDNQFLQEAVIFHYRELMKKKNIAASAVLSIDDFIAEKTSGQTELFRKKRAWIIKDGGSGLPKESEEKAASKKAGKEDGKKVKKESSKEKGAHFLSLAQSLINEPDADPFIFIRSAEELSLVPELLKNERVTVFSCYGKKPWEKSADSMEWMEWFASKNGFSLEKEALQSLYESADGDFLSLKNELEKCMTYALSSKKITMTDVQAVCLVKEKANLMKLFDEILAGSKSGIMKEMSLIEEEERSHPIAILRFIKQQALLFIDILSGIKSLPFKSRAYENRLSLATRLGVLRLEEWVRACTTYEVQLRSGEETDDLPSRLTLYLIKEISNI